MICNDVVPFNWTMLYSPFNETILLLIYNMMYIPHEYVLN